MPHSLPCWDLKDGIRFSRTGGVGISLRMHEEGKEKAAGSWLSSFSSLPLDELPTRLWDLSELVGGCGEKALGSGAEPSAVSPSQGKLRLPGLVGKDGTLKTGTGMSQFPKIPAGFGASRA